jgi:hypothetical protein
MKKARSRPAPRRKPVLKGRAARERAEGAAQYKINEAREAEEQLEREAWLQSGGDDSLTRW